MDHRYRLSALASFLLLSLHASPSRADLFVTSFLNDSVLRYDQTTKLRLYASAGIPEYWVVSVEGEWIDVYRVPAGDAYREHRRAAGGDTVAPAAFPDVVVTVADVFA